ncbi:hypothetical protein EVAR_43931_1 [Eumeta japonica]|uniref:Uncharacterized protein n=1 Tax=Eumeta variegata TaxID=151549 RepID=A0A4C1WPE8_EUMVA|nr:hypothetical protein EVAR_43931_1 [Eumeta japonica]
MLTKVDADFLRIFELADSTNLALDNPGRGKESVRAAGPADEISTGCRLSICPTALRTNHTADFLNHLLLAIKSLEKLRLPVGEWSYLLFHTATANVLGSRKKRSSKVMVPTLEYCQPSTNSWSFSRSNFGSRRHFTRLVSLNESENPITRHTVSCVYHADDGEDAVGSRLRCKRACEPRKQVVTATHGHLQRQRSHQCVASLGRNRISDRKGGVISIGGKRE